MKNPKPALLGIVPGVVALLCWLVMFLAGTDVWHHLGRPDIWHLQDPPYPDVRVFVWAFYGLLFVLCSHLVVVLVRLVATASERSTRELALPRT